MSHEVLSRRQFSGVHQNKQLQLFNTFRDDRGWAPHVGFRTPYFRSGDPVQDDDEFVWSPREHGDDE